jgi:hypothetical protein
VPITNDDSNPPSSTVATLISFLIVVPVIVALHAICAYWAIKLVPLMWDFYCGMLRIWWFEQSYSVSLQTLLFILPFRIMTFPFFIGFGFGMSFGPVSVVLISLFASVYYVVTVDSIGVSYAPFGS